MSTSFFFKFTGLLFLVFVSGCGKEKTKRIVEPAPVQQPFPQPQPQRISYAAIQPIFQRSCLPCHGGLSPQSGVDLSSEQGLRANYARASARIQAGTMPPQSSGKTPINQGEWLKISQWFRSI